MAIIGYLEEIKKNNKFNNLIKIGLEYLSRLSESDFKNIRLNDKAVIELNGSKISAINQVYETKGHSKQKFEGHRKFIDLQFVLSGEELIKIASIKDSSEISIYDKEKDVQFFNVNFYSTLLMKNGMVAIFYPDDIHAPGLDNENTCLIKKSVIKVKI